MKNIKTTIIFLTAALLTACNDDFLERYPLSELSPETFFTSETELKSYTNSFYLFLPAIHDSYLNSIEQGDDIAMKSVPNEMTGNRTVPATGNGWTWDNLRSINFYLANSYKCANIDVRNKYDGIARFWRAYFYFEKVVRFGDVPWYDKPIDQYDEEALTQPRDSRTVIYDKMIEDINFAITYCPEERDPSAITKWTALALKSRICLFEGTFRKYHEKTGWEEILRECVGASDEMMRNSGYQIYTSNTGKPYLEMFLTEVPNAEFILAKTFSQGLSVNHYVNLHLQGPSQSQIGMTRDLFCSYLNTDGTRFTEASGYATMSFYESTQNRDPRLGQSIRTQNYTYPGSSTVLQPDFSATKTGYMIAKYVTDITTNNGTNAMPYLRYAEVLLNFAEAKAELGEISQDDIDRSIKLLRDRVGMPNLDMEYAKANPDAFLAAQYLNVSGDNTGIILEIRRERRIELFLEHVRWKDIRRWKEGQLFTKIPRGAYFAGVGDYDLDNDGVIDLTVYSGAVPGTVAGRQYINISELNLSNGSSGEITVNPGIGRSWNESRDYFYAIPLQELQLNPNLVQNPLWPVE